MKQRDPRPVDAARFAGVVHTIKAEGRAAGFELARDIMLESYEQLDEIPAAVRIKLAIDLDKHAMFAEAFATKQQGGGADKWQELQQYLTFQSDAIPQSSVTITRSGAIRVAPPEVDQTDGLGRDDEEDTSDGDA